MRSVSGKHNRANGYKLSPVTNALHEIFENAGDGISYDDGIVRTSLEALNRVRSRCRLPDYELKPPAFWSRDGFLKLPYDEAVQLARSFCMSEPAPVLAAIEATERTWAMQADRPGNEYKIPLLNDYRACWALIRQWCGMDAAVAERQKRIKMLEGLVWDAIYALQRAGLDGKAIRLRSAISKE
jgi:hypothetical protein